MARVLRSLLVIGVLCLGGCGEQLELVEVTGTVSVNGKPLELVQVEFWPSNGPRSIGKTNAEGKFTLEIDDRTRPGAVPGKHKVALRDTWPSRDDYINEGGEWVDMSKGQKSRIHSKYYDPPTSPLSVDVKAEKANSFDFDVDPKR